MKIFFQKNALKEPEDKRGKINENNKEEKIKLEETKIINQY